MDPIFVQPIAVAGIYCIWDYYRKLKLRAKMQLRNRVAFMLWQAAQRAE